MREPRPTPPGDGLARDEDGYPPALRDLGDDAPERVWVRGAVPPIERSIAIVGARAATPYGMAFARALAADLARFGIATVSGLARGIDAAAHRGSLDSGGVTVAVLPGGLDHVAPRHHAALAGEIAARGGLITECASGPPPFRGVFLGRNRLIAALAAATVVVEAGVVSGSLSTAAAARRLGRPLLAVPGDVDRPTSRGTHALLRRGAAVCEGAADVLAALEGAASGAEGVATRGVPSPHAGREGRPPAGARRTDADAAPPSALADLRAALDDRPRGAEWLAARAGLPLDRTLGALLELEWAGVATPHPGHRWSRPAATGPR